MLTAHNITVRYRTGVCALDAVSLEVSRGEVVGLLGPNGAGKSTLLRVLATLQLPDVGTISVAGIDAICSPNEARGHLGFLPQEFGFPSALTPDELIDYIATLRGFTDRAERCAATAALLNRVSLWENRHRQIKTLSGGMKQRLGIAAAVIGAPDVIIVDEPTVALDPSERHRVHDLLLELSADRALLLSTHLVSDVEALCQRTIILHRGRVARSGAPAALIAALRGRVFRAQIAREDAALLGRELRVVREFLVHGAMQVTVIAEGPPDHRFAEADPTLDDVFADAIAP
jgi:ABC-2 type transport system ATP-binding protein